MGTGIGLKNGLMVRRTKSTSFTTDNWYPMQKNLKASFHDSTSTPIPTDVHCCLQFFNDSRQNNGNS